MNRSLDSVKKNISGLRAEAEGLALGLAIRQFGEFIKKNLDLAGSLGETAQQIGVTTRELQVYRAIGGQVGVSQEDIDKGLSKLTVSLGKASVGAKAQNDAFSALGVSVRDASGHVLSTGAALEAIADKLSKVQDPAQRAAAEVAIFGKAGQKLDTILTGGRAGVEAYAKELEKTGVILSDDVVNAADAASDKIEALNTQLTANIANAVAQNAGAILGLANALVSLTTGAINFINTYPRLATALAGAAAGSRFGLPGAIIGAGVGTIGGDAMARSNANGNMDLSFRKARLASAVAEMKHMQDASKPGGGTIFGIRRVDPNISGGVTLEGARQEVYHQAKLLRQAAAASVKPVIAPQVDLPDFLAPGGGGHHSGGGGRRGPSADSIRDKAARDAQDFANDLARLDQDLLSAKRDNLTDVSSLADNARQQLDIETAQLKSGIETDVITEKLSRAQADQLIAKVDQVKAEKLTTINGEEIARLSQEQQQVMEAANDNVRDILSAQESLATSSDERRKLAFELLELDKAEERAKQENIINLAKIGQATAAQAKIAQERLDNLDSKYDLKKEGAAKSTAGPLQSYLDGLPDTAGEINDALQNVAVDGLKSLEDGILSVINGTKSLGAAFKDMASQIIADLLRIQIEKMIVGLASSVFGGGGPTNLLAGTGYASGTSNATPGLHLVGENGPEVVRFHGGEQVIPNNRLRGAGNDNGSVYHINVNGAGMSERQARTTGAQIERGMREERTRLARLGG